MTTSRPPEISTPEIPVAQVAYGAGRIALRMDPRLADWRVIAPKHEPAMDDPQAAFIEACRRPIGSPHLRDLIKKEDRIVIVTSDGTRPVPNRLLLPWLLDELQIPDENITVLLGTGTHRANTPEEIATMFGEDLAHRLAIVNHAGADAASNACIGHAADGTPILVDRLYLEAGKRIVLGYIEPHFFAGFSGGPKGVIPGVAGNATILHLHNYAMIADPQSVWGEIDANPIHRTISEMVALCPPDFLVNVTLNRDKAITGVFAGDWRAAHRRGCEHARAVSMSALPHRYPIVVTSNSGFPLDQNLYQAVKGISAAARIVEEGGTIIVASECRDGFPEHGAFRGIMQKADSPEAVDRALRASPQPTLDQWQAQILANIRMRNRVVLVSSLEAEAVRSAHLESASDLQEAVDDAIRAAEEKIGGGRIEVAVLPEGPITIPYVAG